MKNLKVTAFALAAFTLPFAASGCDDDEAQRSESLQQLSLESGTYTSDRCYLNKISTELSGQNLYSFSDITFNPDGTGHAHFTAYSDANCTTLVSEETVNFQSVSVAMIGSVKVVRLEQDAVAINPVWWLPIHVTNDGYAFDVDYADGESGPYIFEPSVAALESFRTDPEQAVSYTKQ